eukprot:Em0008g1062a
MADVKARLNFSPSVQSPTPLPKRAPSSHLTLSHRPGEYHMTKQNPAILDHLHSPRQASVKDPLIYKSPTYFPPPPTQYTRSPLVHNTSLLQHAINSHRNSQPVGTSLVQLAVRGSKRNGENGLASPMIVRLSGAGSALRPRGGEEEEEHPVANPCDKDVIMSALKQRRKRKAALSSTPDNHCDGRKFNFVGTTGQEIQVQWTYIGGPPKWHVFFICARCGLQKETTRESPCPLEQEEQGGGGGFEAFATLECVTESARVANRGRNKRAPSTRNASSTPPVVEEEEEREESPMLKKKREDSQQLHRTLTTIFPSGSQASSGLRRKLPVFCATGSRPQLATQLTRTHWATDEDLRSDREALTEKVMQFLSEDPEDLEVTSPEVPSITTSTSAAGALVPQRDVPLGVGLPSVGMGSGLSLSSAAPLLTSASTAGAVTGTSGIGVSFEPQSAATFPVGRTSGTSPQQPSQTNATVVPLLGQITSAPFTAGASAPPSQPVATIVGAQIGTQPAIGVGTQPAIGVVANEASRVTFTTEAAKKQGGPLDIGTSSAFPAGLQGMFSTSSSSGPTGSTASGGTQPQVIGLQKSSALPQMTSSISVTVMSPVTTTQPSISLSSSLPGVAAGPGTLPMVGLGGFPSLTGLFQGSTQQQQLPQLGSQQQQLPQQGSQQQLPQLGSQQQQLPQLGSQQQQLPQLGSQQQQLPQLGSQQQQLPQLGSQQQQLPQLGSQQQQLPQLGSQQQQLPQLGSVSSQGVSTKPQGNAPVPNPATSTATNKGFSFALAGNQSASTASLGSVSTVVGTSMAAGGQPMMMAFGKGGQTGPSSQQTTLFGQSQGGGGQSLAVNQVGMFGQSQVGQTKAPGQTTLLGQAQAGQTAAANQCNVLFGQQPTQAPPGSQSNMFGKPAQANQPTLFGQPAQTPAANQSTLLSQLAQAPAANQPMVFGQPAQTPAANQSTLLSQLAQAPAANQPMLFGQPAQTPAANQSILLGHLTQAPTANQSTLFGQPAQPAAAKFGQPAQSPAANPSTLFGQPAQAPAANQSTLFGHPQGKPPQQTMFGQPQAPAAANQPFTFGPSPAAAPNSGQPFVFGKPQVAVPPTQGQQPGQASLFGQVASFNQQQQQQQQQQQLFMFGKPQSGQATTAQTGQTGSIFGPSQPAQTGQTGSIFGQSQPAQTGQTGSIFGPSQPAQTGQTGSIFGQSQPEQNAMMTQPFGAVGGNLQAKQAAAAVGQATMFGQNGPKPAFQFGTPAANQTVSGTSSEGFKFGVPNQVGVVNPSNQGSTGFQFGGAQAATPSSGFKFSSAVQGAAPSLGGQQQQSGLNFQVGAASGFNFSASQAPGNAVVTAASTTGNRTLAKARRNGRR